MGVLVHFPGSGAKQTVDSDNPVGPNSLFQTIPPERIGVDGEYDYYGLAKRVMLAISEQLPAESYQELKVTQRGRVVIMLGRLASSEFLHRTAAIALGVPGAAEVETYGVMLQDRSEGDNAWIELPHNQKSFRAS